MKYEEAYMQCESIEELERMVNKDIKFARVFNIDRIPIIEKSAIKVANLKFADNGDTVMIYDLKGGERK